MTTIKQTGRLAAAPSSLMDPERSSLRRLGNGLLIRAQEVQLLPGPPTHTTSSTGQSAVLLSRRFAVRVRGRVPVSFSTCDASVEADPLSTG